MKFIDEVHISIQSGHGGPGKISFRREAQVPRGGPDGGDGGKGGDVIFVGDRNLNTLLELRYKKEYRAADGEGGGTSNMTGADGLNMRIHVPPGTLIKDNASGEVLADLDAGDEYVCLKGGRGGKGNWFFKSSINQAPTHAQPGEEGKQMTVHLELKLIADVGIIGYPNAGKSTLISAISSARPKVADYPFTTLVPNLGVVRIDDSRSFVVADIPGLIPGAHQGVGLGTQFLRHIERTRVFVHLIDAGPMSGRDPLQDYYDINNELKMHDEQNESREGYSRLMDKPQIIALNKVDTLDEASREEVFAKFRRAGVKCLLVSAAAGYQTKNLIYEIGRLTLANQVTS